MVIKEKKKEKITTRYSDLRVGDVFSMVDYMGGISTRQKFLKFRNGILLLDSFDFFPYQDFYEYFYKEYECLDEDEKDYFIDTFYDREIKIYNATLTIEVD